MMRQRPINLRLLSLHYPLPSIVSILHRLSGLFLIFLIPLLLFALQDSLSSEQAFETLKSNINHPFFQVLLWLALSALGYHLIAGIRHISMDMHWGDSLFAGRISAKIVILLGIIIAIAEAFWIWGK